MSKGTILYIGGFELPDKNAAAHRVINNGKIFRKLGYNVVFIDVIKSKKIDISKTFRIIQGFKCWSISYPSSNKDWIRYLTDISDVRKIIDSIKNVKIVICYNYQSVAFMKLRSFCKKNSMKIIADCTEWYSTKGENLIFRFIKGLDTFLRMRVIQKKLDGLIVISTYLNKYYKNSQENLLLLPPLVDKSEEKWNRLNQKENDKKIQFVYAGSPGKNKDKLNLIIKAFSKLNNQNSYMLHFIGITKKEYLDNQLCNEENLKKIEKNVKFVGRVSHEESIQNLKAADYSIFIRELNRVNMAGFPTKFVEAISCKTKVITNNSSDLKDYINEGINGYMVNINDDSLERLLNNMLNGDIDSIKYVIKETDSNLFDYHNYIDKTYSFTEKLLRNRD